MTKPRTLSHAVRLDIARRFANDAEFTIHEFAALARAFGKPIKSVTHILRDMADKGLLEVMGEQTNPHGGGNTKRYAIIAGAQLTPKTSTDWQREIRQRDAIIAVAADRLQAALDSMTRARYTA